VPFKRRCDPIIFRLSKRYLIPLSSDSPKCIRKIKKPIDSNETDEVGRIRDRVWKVQI